MCWFDEIIILLNKDFSESSWARDEKTLDVEDMKIANEAFIGYLINPSLSRLSSRFTKDREKMTQKKRGALGFLVTAEVLPG
jgi:hypothetical protein